MHQLYYACTSHTHARAWPYFGQLLPSDGLLVLVAQQPRAASGKPWDTIEGVAMGGFLDFSFRICAQEGRGTTRAHIGKRRLVGGLVGR